LFRGSRRNLSRLHELRVNKPAARDLRPWARANCLPTLAEAFTFGRRARSIMTTANKITVVRILMIPVFVTMAIYYGQSIQRGQPLEWQRFTAIAIFLAAAVSDGLDGYVARRYKQRSTLGAILDPIADKGLLLSAIITLSISNWSDIDPEYGRFPAWFPVLVITRDAVILVGAGILHLLNGKVHVKPSWTGKVATVLQMAAIAWVMLQLHFLPLLYVVIAAGVFTFISGIIYVMDGVRQLQAEGHAHAKVD
jgi:cardiolipin synthase (CMP-forming)